VIYDFTAGSPHAVLPGGSGSSAASAAVRSFNPRRAVPGRAAAPQTAQSAARAEFPL